MSNSCIFVPSSEINFTLQMYYMQTRTISLQVSSTDELYQNTLGWWLKMQITRCHNRPSELDSFLGA